MSIFGRERAGSFLEKEDSLVKKKKIMPFAPTWMDPEIITISKESQRSDNYHATSLRSES